MTATEETLKEIRPLLRVIVWERIGSQTHLADDAEQEALIAAWTRLLEGRSVGIAVHAAKQAVIDVVRGRRATGSASRETMGQVDAHATRSTPLTRRDAHGEEYHLVEPECPQTEREITGVDIRDALQAGMELLSLPERETVYSLFYRGFTRTEIAAEQGISRQAIDQRVNKAYAKMRPLLEGLL